MPEITGVDKVVEQLQRKILEAKEANCGVVVGYEEPYAIYVHENLEAHHAEGKQAKFLETPARQLNGELRALVLDLMRKGLPLKLALYQAGVRLLRASQEIVPVDTGALKASGYVKIE